MEGSFVEALVEATSKPVITTINGIERALVPTEGCYTELELPVPEPAPRPLTLSTLSGLEDYIEQNRDGIALETCVLQVASPEAVNLLGPLHGHFRQRNAYAVASSVSVIGTTFSFGRLYALEQLIVSLQALFVQDDARDEVLRVLSSVRDDDVRVHADDGISQEVTARKGVHLGESVRVPNPVTLRPYRTFREIEQPASSFVLRLVRSEGGPQAALFESDGGGWKLEAIESIARYLREAKTEPVAVIA